MKITFAAAGSIGGVWLLDDEQRLYFTPPAYKKNAGWQPVTTPIDRARVISTEIETWLAAPDGTVYRQPIKGQWQQPGQATDRARWISTGVALGGPKAPHPVTWAVNMAGRVFRWDYEARPPGWVPVGQPAEKMKMVSVGDLWDVIGIDERDAVLRWRGGETGGWQPMGNLQAKHVSAGFLREFWCVGLDDRPYRWKEKEGRWHNPGQATDRARMIDVSHPYLILSVNLAGELFKWHWKSGGHYSNAGEWEWIDVDNGQVP